uniref:Arrestin_C domain-containing protein n=1 Tax=Caenorhabditis tropicalis TaxID=1561998 RepID=A0A1I7V3Q4_9PELO
MGTDSDIVARFDIHLDAGDEPVFKGGELITGKLLIELRKPIIINAVKLQMKGRAAWLNDPLKKDDIEKVYFDQDFTLLERPPGKPEPGHFQWIGDFIYSLPFECPLPKGCPSTYEGPHAFIRYFIRASLVQEDEFEKIHEYYVKKAFTLVSPSEGHIINGESAQTTDTAILGKCCCKSKLSAELALPKTGYLPGESIYGNLKIGNKHSKDILNHMEARLVDRVRRIGAPEISAASPWRTLYVRKLESNYDSPSKTKGAIEQSGLFLLTVPPVCPSTKGDYEDPSKFEHILSPYGKLLESPSTATLRFRRIPFLKIEYGIQVTLGSDILLEIPIEIGELSTRDKSNTLQSFITGPQPVEEADEKGKIAVNGPFVYTPVYPYPKNSETNGKAANITVIATEPNSHHHDPEKTIITTTRTVVTHSDGHKSETMEETVVETEGETVKTVVESTVEDGVKSEKKETTTIDASGDEKTSVETSKTQVSERAEIPEEIKEARNQIEELVENQLENSSVKASAAEPTVETVVNENGEETIVSTEVIEDGNSRTIKTTTVTKHSDGGETTFVQENTTTETITNVLEE